MVNLSKISSVIVSCLAIFMDTALADPIHTTQLQTISMSGQTIWHSDAMLIPLVFDRHDKPISVLIKVPANRQANAAHATGDGKIRFAIVLSGTLYYADGERVEKAKEKAYPTGSVLLISSGVPHWVSTRDEPVELFLTAADPENLSPPVKKQLSIGEMGAVSDVTLGSLNISGLFARASAGKVKAGGAFMTITNKGDADKLLSASAAVSEKTELHTHIKDGEVMRMRQVDHIDIPANGKVELKPGSYHVMFIGLKRPLEKGQFVPVELIFEKAGRITVDVEVGSVGATGPAGHSMKHIH